MQKQNSILFRILGIGCSIILILLPFHAVFTTYLASHFQHFDLFRIWKEIILAFMCAISLVILIRDKYIRSQIFGNNLWRVAIVYLFIIVMSTVYGIITGNVTRNAAIYGFIINTRFIIFMAVIKIASMGYTFQWKKILFYPAVIVVLFALLQMTVLPKEFLTHFGYNKNTILPFQNVDGKPVLLRLQSSLRGPNSLGAYMAMLLIYLMTIVKGSKNKFPNVIFFTLGLIVLYATYSRSAYLGFILGTFLFFIWSIKNMKIKKLAYIGLSTSIVFLSVFVIAQRENDIIQNLVFHTNEKSESPQSSNEQRAKALTDAVKDIANEPFGRGVGSAGPASLRNDNRGRLSENYLLQVGQEAGIIGLLGLSAFLATFAKRFWIKRNDILARATLSTFAALLLINMLTHAWADDTVAYLFFGISGIVLAKTSTKSEKLATL